MIKKEYTYNDPARYNRNENEQSRPADCFTEHHIDSVYNSLQNITSKSVILAPFNSTATENDMRVRTSIQPQLLEKMMVINLHRRIREIDRQYEFNNNGQLDNGVYHKGDETQENAADEDDIPADQVVQESPKNDPLNVTDEVRA